MLIYKVFQVIQYEFCFHITSRDRQKEIYMERHTLQLEHFISKLNVKEYKMQEPHYYQQQRKNFGIVYMSQTNIVSKL